MKKAKSTIILVLVLAAIVVVGLFVATMPEHIRIKIKGSDVSGSSASSVAGKIADEYESMKVTLTSDSGVELTGTMKDFGYAVDQDAMTKSLEDARAAQVKDLSSRMGHIASGVIVDVSLQTKFDQNTFTSYVQQKNLRQARTKMTDGSVNYDESTQKYVMTEAKAGNEVNDGRLQAAVQKKLNGIGFSDLEKGSFSMKIPDEVYENEDVDTENANLKKEVDTLNTYATAKITYQFGSQTETLDIGTFHDWLTYSDGNVSLDDSKVKAYVEQLAGKYNTRYKDRGFQTTGGSVVTIPSSHNEYGYRINQDQEAAQIKTDLASGKEVTREPIYDSKNSYGNPVYYGRNGVDDLNGTYVEVSISQQHLWFYKNGQLVVESDVVTGNTSAGHGTITGAFPIAFKVSPYTMSSAENGYVVNVQYWMPFYDGEGLHDASWRSSFGGTIYQTDGSHGCVNLPTNVAATIYNNCEPGMAVILY